MTVNELFKGADLKRIRKAVRTVFSKGEVTVEARLTSKDGEKTPYLFSAVSTRIEDASYVLGMGIDLTELKQTQDALRESEIFYRVLAERMTVGAMLCQSSRIVFANDALLSMFGYRDAGELVRQGYRGTRFQGIRDVFPGDVRCSREEVFRTEVLRDPLLAPRRDERSGFRAEQASSSGRASPPCS